MATLKIKTTMAEQNILKYTISQCSSHSATFIPEYVFIISYLEVLLTLMLLN